MENELKTNAKRLSPEEQYQIRKSIVRMSKQGKSNPEIAQALDVSERHVRNVKQNYEKKRYWWDKIETTWTENR